MPSLIALEPLGAPKWIMIWNGRTGNDTVAISERFFFAPSGDRLFFFLKKAKKYTFEARRFAGPWWR